MTNLKTFSLGLTGSTIMSLLIAPLAAYGQFSPVQNAEQSVTIRGNNNTVNQRINQTIVIQPGSDLFPRIKKPKFKKPKFGRDAGKYWKKGKGHSKSRGWHRVWDRDDDDWDDDDDSDDDDD